MTYSLKALNGHRSTIAYQRVALEATLEVTLEPQPSYPGAPAQLPWRLPWSPKNLTSSRKLQRTYPVADYQSRLPGACNLGQYPEARIQGG